jgi:FkbM family methyltransferase
VRVPRFLRRIADPITERIPLPIAGGVNRGLRWSLASSGHGYGSGRRAAKQMQVIAALIRPGDVVWDVGAHHGYVTLCAATRAGAGGSVHAFEPSASNRIRLQRHVQWNRLANVRVHPYALSDSDGEATFGGAGSSKTFALGGGSERVQVRRATSLLDGGTLEIPTFVKVDVEGAEASFLRGAIERFRPDTRFLIAMHSAQAYRDCVAVLEPLGYTIIPSRGASSGLANPSKPWPSDPDVYCAGPAHTGLEADKKALRDHEF